MEPPASIAARLYLLATDPARQRIGWSDTRGYLMRAAVLEELRLAGAIVDDAGKIRLTPGPERHADPVVGPVLHAIATHTRPRTWPHWVRTGERATHHAVRDRLEDSLYVRVEHRRLLGILPLTRVTVRDPRVVEELREAFTRTLTGTGPTDASDAAIVALADAAELGTVLPRRLRRQYRDRIRYLTTSPVVPALRKVIRARRTAIAAAGGGGG